MNIHIENRETNIIRSLREELFGPAPAGDAIDCGTQIIFPNKEASYGPWKQLITHEEILDRVRPTQRYGIGVLYPIRSKEIDDSRDKEVKKNEEEMGDNNFDDAEDASITENGLGEIEKIEKKINQNSREKDTDDFDISTANSYKPSSMGISFLADLPAGSTFVVTVTAGRYVPVKVIVEGSSARRWWKRVPVTISYSFDTTELTSKKTRTKYKPIKIEPPVPKGLEIDAVVYSRPHSNSSITQRLITVCIINRKEADKKIDESCLFQCGFEVTVNASTSKKELIFPYPTRSVINANFEERSLALLYRKIQTFAIGHGCAANWSEPIEEKVLSVKAEALPMIETPSITSDTVLKSGIKIEIPIKPLAGLTPGDDGSKSIRDLLEGYRKWIDEQRLSIDSIPIHHKETAEEHMRRCEEVLRRMEGGVDYLNKNLKAKRAFQLANYAILLQQIKSDIPTRKRDYDPSSATPFKFSFPYPITNVDGDLKRRGNWRAFQMAFLLMSVQSVAEGGNIDRKTVELIWFPTGGGKTEAYLGLSAFAMFHRRLINPNDIGVHILMRYTLRLLTAQQFQRASGLICSMEYLRRIHNTELGSDVFSIGLWLGGDVTPNKRANAITEYKNLVRDPRGKNPFILDRCPWCKAFLGRLDLKNAPKSANKVEGYYKSGNTVVFKCPDSSCDFKDGLPIYVIDEDIYEKKPTMVIGTVDKFATLAWKPEARSLFGFNFNGERVNSPPGLIIQDELHLISGPLGSMVGLYETIVEELCTDRRFNPPILPKIVSSTATIRQYEKQIKSLYARENITLFPPPGLEDGNSFFSSYAKSDDGKLLPGKIYVGVFAPGHGSMQTTQVRTFSALLQSPMKLSLTERDPWWTLMLFFNSLRELGTTLSLFQSDIPIQLSNLRNRYDIDPKNRRWLNKIKELTGRLRSDEIPAAISELELKTDKTKYPVDVCLASNIIEVGIDIDRLSLLSVVGQPKTTSQYIQVTGRVGRNWVERPGLVVTLYGVGKPRDRSHFEKFRSYHEKLYAQVEPTSATPFSAPVLDRALHGLMAAYVRQVGSNEIALRPNPYPAELLEKLKNILIQRVRIVDPDELDNFTKIFNKRISEWKKWKPIVWTARISDDRPLMYASGSYVNDDLRPWCWATPQSLRNVDAECEAYVTQLYNDVDNLDVGEIYV